LAALLVCLAGAGQWGRAATFTVTTNADAGPGSLRQAILNSGAVDTIAFRCLPSPCTIVLASPLPPITKNGASLIIDGGTLGNVIIDGASSYRVFFVDSGTVLIKNLIIQNAKAQGGNGGGVLDGDSGGAGGGGAGLGAGLFVNQPSGATTVVTVTNVYFLNCTAAGGAGGSVSGMEA